MRTAGSTRPIAKAACAVLFAVLLPRVASSYPEDCGPFEENERPGAFHTYPCSVVEAEGSGHRAARSSVTFARNDGRPRSARMRLTTRPDGVVLMTVLGPDGRVLAGPERISDGCLVLLPAFWADLNGDGREDFIVLVVTAFGEPACTSDVGFALSSEKGYRITGVRQTMGPGANDFVDLGDGKCRFIHTCLVSRRRMPGEPLPHECYRVYSLLEFQGDRRFPKWVRATAKPNHRAATLTAARRKLLWEAEPERIFRTPSRKKAPATVIASSHE